MTLSHKYLQIFSGKASFRPLRRAWLFTWIILCVVAAVKLTMDFLGLQTEFLSGWHMAVVVSLLIALLVWLF
ncbi:MAG: hypothetical protein KKH28_09810 [Elusimicrobia bacterium]|nr:hypothetical protein [Elusimicrobiota bacterium]